MTNDYHGLNGRIQAHVEGFHKDYNRANILARLYAMGGRCLIVVNDWELAREWLKLGGVAQLRIKGDGWLNDDDGDAHDGGSGYATHVCSLLDKATEGLGAEAKARAWGSLGNELGSTEPERQDDYGASGIGVFTARGYKVCFGNWSIQNPDDDPATPILEHFAKLPRTIAALRANGGRMGFHEGTDAFAPSVSTAIAQGKIGRFVAFQKQYGIKVWITEFTGSETAHEGWRTLYRANWRAYRDVIESAVRLVYEPYDAWVSLFTLGVWSVGNNFDIMHEDGLQGEIAALNSVYQIKEESSVATFYYAPAYVCPWLNTRQFRLWGRGDEHCQSILRTDGIIDFMKNAQCEEFRVGEGYLWRGKDTSDLYTPDGRQNGEYYIPYSAKPESAADRLKYYFSKWLPEWVYIDQLFVRRVYVERTKADGTIIPEKTGWHETTIRVVAHHPSYTFPRDRGGMTIPDVLQLHVDGVEEDYLYARHYGLIGHADRLGGGSSYIATTEGINIHPRANTRTNPRPIVAPPPAAYPAMPPGTSNPNTPPAPETLGDPVEQVVSVESALVSNLREKPDADGADAGRVVGSVKIGDRVMARPVGWTGNGYTWRHITAKNGMPLNPPAWLASVAKLINPPAPPEPILALISYASIHVSQLGLSADLRQNDCGMAILQAAALRKLQANNLYMPLLEQVDYLIAASPLATGDLPVGVQGMKDFAALLGVTLTHTILTETVMMREIDEGREVIILGNYGHLKPGARKVGHWFTLVGYTANGWIINDPLDLGAMARITRANMKLAQTDLTTWNGGTFAGVPMQGFFVA